MSSASRSRLNGAVTEDRTTRSDMASPFTAERLYSLASLPAGRTAARARQAGQAPAQGSWFDWFDWFDHTAPELTEAETPMTDDGLTLERIRAAAGRLD